jgi:penicillin-binding protein 2
MRQLLPFQGWRLTFFQGVIVAVFLIFAIRMYDIQVLRSETYIAAANENRLSQLPIASNRGVIYDRNNLLLAKNAPAYVVEIVPAELPGTLDERYVIYNRLSALIGVPPTISAEVVGTNRIRSIERIVQEGEGVRPYSPVAVASDVDRRVAMRIMEEQYTLPGVSINTVSVREYPTGELTAHIVGYMGPIGPEEAERLLELGYNPAYDRVGYDGIEASLEPELSGQRGSELREVDVAGEVLRRLSVTPPQAGQSVRLTIDTELQEAAVNALRDRINIINQEAQTRNNPGRYETGSGVVVALNPMNGEVLALVSYPSYDNSRFARAIDGEYYLRVLNDPLTPLVNHTIGSLYPPGSGWKLITSAGVMEEDVIAPTQQLFDGGDLIVQNRYAPNDPAQSQRFVCWNREGHGNLNLIGAIAQSCNVYFYQVGGGNPDVSPSVLRDGGLGINNLFRYATALGIGTRLGIELPGEISGRMPDPDWKRRSAGENWSTGDTYNAAFGQGFLNVTPLQLTVSVQGLIAGTVYQPTLIKAMLDESGAVIDEAEPIVARTLNLDRPNPDGTLTLWLVEDMIMKGESSLACTCETTSPFYNAVRCNPSVYRNTVDVNPDPFIDDLRPYQVHVPRNYRFNNRYCDPNRFNINYVPAFLSEESMDIVRRGMRETILTGTAQTAAIEGVTVAGKTGTAEYCDNIAWPLGLCEQGNWPAHAWFTAYAPYESPEILVISMIYNGEEGSKHALPVVREVMQAYFDLKEQRSGNALVTAPQP